MQLIFYYLGIVKETGNKGKFILCFRHAVAAAVHGNVDIQTEIIPEGEFWFCHECEQGN